MSDIFSSIFHSISEHAEGLESRGLILPCHEISAVWVKEGCGVERLRQEYSLQLQSGGEKTEMGVKFQGSLPN